MNIGKPFREDYSLTQGFGEHPTWYAKFGMIGHNGLDFRCPTGTTIIACDDGTIGTVADDPTGYGHYIKVIHSWGESIYAHLQNHLVTVGFPVKRGQTIGISDNSGNSTGPHLHFGIRINPYSKNDGWSGYTDPQPHFGEPESPPEPPEQEFTMREQFRLLFSVLHSNPNPTEGDIDQAVGSALPPYEYGVQDLNNRVIPISVESLQLKINQLETLNKELNDKITALENNPSPTGPSDPTTQPPEPIGEPTVPPAPGVPGGTIDWNRYFPLITKLLNYLFGRK